MRRTICPAEDELVGFALGYLSETVLAEVAEHVDSCSQCEGRVQKLDHLTDSALVALRRPAPSHKAAEAEPRFLVPAPQGGQAETEIPSHLGDYHILRELGRGGMGLVFEAEQESLSRQVALKVLPKHLAFDSQRLERFHREARAAARLHHTNIVPVFDVGQDRGFAFYAMQLIHGQGLDRIVEELCRLQKSSPSAAAGKPPPASGWPTTDPAACLAHSLLTGQFKAPEPSIARLTPTPVVPPNQAATATVKVDSPLGSGPSATLSEQEPVDPALAVPNPHGYFRQVARLGQQAAEALAYAHGQGILHRDVKPSNLLLDAAGTLWVTDFGLAKTQEHALTKSDQLLGTLRYMAPERFTGQCDVRSDLYGLGLTLYELLVLKPAFDARDSLLVLNHVQTREPARPRTLDPRIPRDLETIVLKTIDKDPAARYQAAHALAEDLRRFGNDEPIRARRASLPERLARWARQHKAVAASLLALVGLLVAVAVASTLIAFDRSMLVKQKEAERQKAHDAASEAEEQFQSAYRNLYAAKTNLTGMALDEPSGITQVAHLLDEYRGWKPSEDPRGWEWFYGYTLVNRGQLTLRGHLSDAATLAWSRDGKRLASGGFDTTIRIWDPATGRQLLSFPAPWGSMGLSWSPDGRRLASADWKDRSVTIWDPASGKKLHTLLGHRAECWTVSWCPDGRRLASVDQHSDLIVWDTTTGKPLYSLVDRPREGQSVSWSPDGRRFATSVGNQVSICDGENGKQVRALPGHTSGISAVCWSPDGRKLASASEDATVRIWDAATGATLRTLTDTRLVGFAGDLCWAPDSRQLAGGCADLAVRIWDTEAATPPITLRGHTGSMIGAVCWDPLDGSRLASSERGWNGAIKIWKLTLASEPFASPLGDLTGSAPSVCWSADGRTLASAHRDGVVQTWNAVTGQRILALRGHTRPVGNVSWAPHGERLASGDAGGTVKLWDTATGRELGTLAHTGHPVASLSWSQDGAQLVAGFEDTTVYRWETATYTNQVLPFRGLGGVISPKRNQVALGDNYKIHLFDIESGAEVRSWSNLEVCHNQPYWSPVGTHIASISDYSVEVRDARTGEAPYRPLAHTLHVDALAWSPDGKQLATGTRDHAVHLWDAVTGHSILTLRDHSGPITSLVWSPDGMRLLVACTDGRVKIWDATPGYEAERAPALLGVLDTRLAARPHDEEALRLRAGAYARLGDWDKAAADVELLLQNRSPTGAGFFQAGWWITDVLAAGASTPPPSEQNPFERQADKPPSAARWYISADDPNGYVPLHHDQPYYVTRLYALRDQEVEVRLEGAKQILPRLWVNGTAVTVSGPARVALRQGWNTLVARVEGVDPSSNFLYRPRIGFYLQLTARGQ